MKARTPFGALCGCVLALAACKTADTHFSQSYRNPGYEATVFKKVMVIGVAQDQKGRQAFEEALVAAIDAGGFDPVRITRVLSVDKSKEYTPPKAYNNPQTRYYSASPGWGYGYGGLPSHPSSASSMRRL